MTGVPETGAGRMESIYDSGFWSVCHGLKSTVYNDSESEARKKKRNSEQFYVINWQKMKHDFAQ